MKKKDQESLRKIVIIGLVLVVGYLGYQSMTSSSSPIGEAQVPNKCDKDEVEISVIGTLTAIGEKEAWGFSSRQAADDELSILKKEACKEAKSLLEESCESKDTEGKNPIRKSLEAFSLRSCMRSAPPDNPDCFLVSHKGSLDKVKLEKSTCTYENFIVARKYKFLGLTILNRWDVRTQATADYNCNLVSKYRRCTLKSDQTLNEVIPPTLYPNSLPDTENGAWYPFR